MSRLRNSRIIIAGGGIGGAAHAFAMARNGAQVILLERTPEFGEVGAGLQIGPHGARILDSWGLLDEVLTNGFLPKNIIFRDALNAAELTRVPLGTEFRRRYGGPYLVTHRTDLHATLLRAARDAGADLRTGVTVTDAVTVGDEVIVATADGGSMTADVVLGLDGLRSRLRARVSDDVPVASGYSAFRGAVPINELELDEDVEDVVGYIGPRCHFIQYPLRGGRMLNQVAVFGSPAYQRGERDWGGPEELHAAFSHCHDRVQNAIKYLGQERWWPMYDREPLSNWMEGRLLLLGDAAHPPLQYLATGAVMALEDARCVEDFAVDAFDAGGGTASWPAILKEVNTERAPRCNRIMSVARTWGELWHLEGTARLVRNELFETRDPTSHKYTDWLFGYSNPRRPG